MYSMKCWVYSESDENYDRFRLITAGSCDKTESTFESRSALECDRSFFRWFFKGNSALGVDRLADSPA